MTSGLIEKVGAIHSALTEADQVEYLRRGCEREAEALGAEFPNGKGHRGRYRNSWGAASLTRSILHCEEWVMLVDLPTLTPIVTAIFGSADYHLRAARGDFFLPGAIKCAGKALQDCGRSSSTSCRLTSRRPARASRAHDD